MGLGFERSADGSKVRQRLCCIAWMTAAHSSQHEMPDLCLVRMLLFRTPGRPAAGAVEFVQLLRPHMHAALWEPTHTAVSLEQVKPDSAFICSEVCMGGSLWNLVRRQMISFAKVRQAPDEIECATVGLGVVEALRAMHMQST